MLGATNEWLQLEFPSSTCPVQDLSDEPRHSTCHSGPIGSGRHCSNSSSSGSLLRFDSTLFSTILVRDWRHVAG